jgi:endonuclease YncB( thermonuclease family)
MDTIRGQVINIVDGDTFDMRATHVGKQNRYRYNDIERVRIAEIDEPELNTPTGRRSKHLLQQKLLGKEVRCYVQARDEYGRIVAKVSILAPMVG